MRITVAMSRQGVLRARLGESLDIASASEARSRLLQVSESADRLELDLSSLSDIDTAGIQLLIALRRERSSRGRELRIVHPSQPVQDALLLLGVRGLFDEAVSVPKEHP